MRRTFALVFFFCLIWHKVYAQQTVFNVPSQDALQSKHIYVEIASSIMLRSPAYFTMTPKIVLGLGYGFEGGARLPFYLSSGDSRGSRTVVSAKHVDFLGDSTWRFIESADGYLPLSHGKNLGLLACLQGAKEFPNLFRISGGIYAAMKEVTGTKNEFGTMASLEIPIQKFVIAADNYSGENELSAISFGIIGNVSPNFKVKVAYQYLRFSTSDNLLMAVGYQF